MALRLWHLRSWSWPVTLSMIWIMNVYTICCLELLLGPGYLRGLCAEPTSRQAFNPNLWQDYPLGC
ncbi:unnamed protein product [Symbiodinium pilosum]|uniref:Uncharacterized protein n=1 Tax=Symbiodinium pilosum TaxID=2952 RepID=A0A812M7S6_SYMPI|nr:unnamed protein product [Symbiodinium pilosum]